MTVHDLWEDLSKAEIAQRRKSGRIRYQRRWRGPDLNPKTGKPAQHKQGYKEAQKAQAYLDDANQMGQPKAQAVRRSSISVNTLLDRHLAAKADRAPKTLEVDQHHAGHVRDQFGDRVVSTLDTTEIEIWSQRPDVARSSRKKQLEILRAALKRGIRDKLIDYDPTEEIVVSLGHQELPHYTSDELNAVVAGARDHLDKTLLSLLGFMGLRSGEARSLKVGDLVGGYLSVKNSGGGTDKTKTRASRRVLPVPAKVLPLLEQQAGERPKSDWMFPSPRKAGSPIAKRYVGDALTRAVGKANEGRAEPIERITVHGLRHTFAAMSLSELESDLIRVSKAMGHARPSITLDRYGHMAPGRLELLMADIDALIKPSESADDAFEGDADDPDSPQMRPEED